MGKFLTALHVKTTGKEQFIEKFTQLMKKDGYVPCSEDEAAVSYAAAFSEGGWVTLSNGDSTTTELSKTAKKIAKEMDTLCFTAEVVDSDFAILNLFAQNGSESRVIVGDGSGYGIEKAPFLADMWKPLIQSGDESEFVRTLGLENTFAEDTLYDIGKIFGITPSVMTWCYDEFEEEIGHDENVISLSFRKAAEKKLSLNAAFKQVFGEALKPLGFKMIKSKYPYFVRVVPGGEIIHIITYMENWCPYPGKKKFNVISGIATVYRYKIDLSCAPKDNCGWLYSIARFYAETTPESEFNNEYRLSICHFTFDENVENSMNDTLNNALELTRKYILPQLDTAVDLKSSLTYLKRLGQSTDTCNFNSKLNFSGAGDESEGFLYVKVDDEEFKTLLKNMIDGTVPSDEESRQRAEEKLKFFDDPVIHEKVLLELERRKAANMEILKIYGLFL